MNHECEQRKRPHCSIPFSRELGILLLRTSIPYDYMDKKTSWVWLYQLGTEYKPKMHICRCYILQYFQYTVQRCITLYNIVFFVNDSNPPRSWGRKAVPNHDAPSVHHTSQLVWELDAGLFCSTYSIARSFQLIWFHFSQKYFAIALWHLFRCCCCNIETCRNVFLGGDSFDFLCGVLPWQTFFF